MTENTLITTIKEFEKRVNAATFNFVKGYIKNIHECFKMHLSEEEMNKIYSDLLDLLTEHVKKHSFKYIDKEEAKESTKH